MVASLLGGRYELVRSLGRGALGEVFEANDIEVGATVALKRFHDNSARNLLELKREFRLLAGIYERGLVQFYDLVVDGADAFFTMELVDGTNVLEYARAAGLPATLATFAKIGDALAALHDRGYLHRDLKPANILVRSDGEIRILDFGLAGPRGMGSGGTLAYMAPETIVAHEVSPASDWYAFGSVLYEVLTGALPAAGELSERLLRVQRRRFRRPVELVPQIPGPVDELVWRLLHPDPRERASRADVIAALGTSSNAPRARSTALVGRERELAWLASQLELAKRGRASVARLEGRPGIGKSALVRALLATAEARACRVLVSAARPQEFVPLRAIDALVDQLVELLHATRTTVAPPPALVQAFPVFATLGLPPGDEVVRVDAAEARREAQNAVAELLVQLAAQTPLIVWIDDLQWADDESLKLLERVAACNGAILIVLTGRPDAALADRAGWLQGHASLTLEPLDARASRQLLESRVQSEPLAEEAIDRALAEAQGNAFLIEFYARDSGLATLGMQAALAAVLDTLDVPARILFDCIALAQQPMPLACIGHVIPRRHEVRGHVEQLTARGLISLDDRERVTPYHDTIRETATAGLDGQVRQSRHDALATALIASRLPIEWQIPHLEGAGRRAEAATASLTAARAASTRYAFEIASAYYTKALALGELGESARLPILDELAGNLSSAGRGRDASARYVEAATGHVTQGNAELAIVMRQRAAIALLRSGSIDDGRTMLADALESFGERLPRAPVLAAVVEALRLLFAARNKPARELTAPQRLRLEALFTSAVTLSMYDPIVANAITLRFVRSTLAAGASPWTTRALSLEASFLSALGGRYRDKARLRVREMRERLHADSSHYDAAWTVGTAASTAWLAGEIRECLDFVTLARGEFHQAPETNAHELALIEAFRLPAMTMLGDFDAALAGAKDTIAVAEERGDEFAMLPCLHGHITLAYLAAGRGDEAARHVERAREIGQRGSSPLPAYHQAWSRAVIALYRGDGATAHGGIREAWPRLRKLGMLRLEAVVGDLRYVRARCALAAGQLGDAVAQARWLRASTLGYGNAAAAAIDTMILAARGADARQRALEVSEMFEGLGLLPDRDAFARWGKHAKPEPIDRIYLAGPSIVGRSTAPEAV